VTAQQNKPSQTTRVAGAVRGLSSSQRLRLLPNDMAVTVVVYASSV
jgi:hypothetical protein